MTHPPGMAVIVTRARPGAEETAAALEERGYRAILSPMLQIVPIGLDLAALAGVRELVFTSANGVRAFAGTGEPATGLTAWCVGPSTAAAARETGFARIVEGDGDADDLARQILALRGQVSGPLLHIANDAAAGNLVAALKQAGLDARFAAAYRTDPSPTLSAPALAALAEGPAILLVHSAKGAAAVAQTGAYLGKAVIVAISAAAAAPLQGAPVAGLHIAGRPNEAALMATLAEAAASLAS